MGAMEQNQLELEAVIGFSGKIRHGLHLHPGGEYLVYPLGSTVVIRNISDPSDQTFLQGHSDRVSCMAISADGRYIATGQITHMGFQADIIVWDFETKGLVHRLTLHKVRVQALAFSCNSSYLASIGGEDDNNLVVWNVETGKAICGSPAAHDLALTVAWLRTSEEMLVTGGHNNLRVWDFDLPNRKVRPTDCHMGQNKRIINCIALDDRDQYMYCGAATGDVFQVRLDRKIFVTCGPKKRLNMGVMALQQHPSGDLVCGTGDGAVAILDPDSLQVKAMCNVMGGVTSVSLAMDGSHLWCGTKQSNIYLCHLSQEGVTPELKNTCHYDKINDACFPHAYSELFATCSGCDIRVWHSRTCSELLRIQVPNLECNCIAFLKNGSQILSGWSDGKIRGFGPQTGKLLYVINDAHRAIGVGNPSGGVVPMNGVTAIQSSHSCDRLISGGADGQVRVWKITNETQVMIASMKEHKGPVYCIAVRGNDMECVSASADGSCIVWDLTRFVRANALFAATFFKSVVYHPDESQMLTTGTDRKITYWDAYEMNQIRIIDGSDVAELNSIDINSTGEWFVTGSSDKMMRLWNYDEGMCHWVGLGHSGSVSKVVIAPDEQHMVSVGTEGGIFLWKTPPNVSESS